MIDNPIYIGCLHMGDTVSSTHENLRIIDDFMFKKCQETVKGRSNRLGDHKLVPSRTDTRSLLSGMIFCAECGSRLTFSHNTTRRKRSDGTVSVYERDCYRCYRKINARESCKGQSAYTADIINDGVLYVIRRIFTIIRHAPQEKLLSSAKQNHIDMYEVTYKQAEKDFFEAGRQIAALEEQTMKYLTGENTVDITIVNAMMPKYREKLKAAKTRMEEAKAQLEKEKESTTVQEVADLRSWAERFDAASNEEKHMIIARLVERIEINRNYEVSIKLRISLEQYIEIAS